jgi:hypothetical protein
MIQSIEDGRKEDGNRSIADKIIKRLHDLDKTVENNQGRWAWELLQNAKDSIANEEDRKISVQIILSEDKVEFRHNGLHFTEQDVRGLINQISSKEIEEGQRTKKTGRFGTGFLTTHLLSKVIEVKGIVETESSDFYNFEFPLDREGKTTAQLIPKIENAWSEFHKSTKLIESTYDSNHFNTSFSYHLVSDEQKSIAKTGVKEFSKLIPYVLAFIPKIFRVEIIDQTTNSEIGFESTGTFTDENILEISKIENKHKQNILILISANEQVAIASEILKIGNNYSFKNNKDIPKLFCDFPLIGSETFHFPVIVNSFFFNPQTERDGVWLKGKKEGEDKEVDENQQLLEEAVQLFNGLITKISQKNFIDFYNIAETRMPLTNEKYFDDNWYREYVQKPIREMIFSVPIVELENDSTEKQAIKELWFPLKSYSDLVQTKIWQFTYDLYPSAVCRNSHLHFWCAKSWDEWNRLNYNELISDLAKQEGIIKLGESLRRNENDTLEWLNSLYKFVLEEESNLALFEKDNIIPNQNGFFKKRAELYIDKIKDEELLEVLDLLGENWKSILLHEDVFHRKYVVKEKKSIADKITEKLRSYSAHDDDTVKAISLLSEWFENNQELGKELFSELYRKRAELFMNTISDKESLYKVMRSKTDLGQLSKLAQALEDNPQLLESVKRVEELTNLLSEFNVSDVSELKQMLKAAQSIIGNGTKLEITQDVLVSLGVTSIEELEAALTDKEIATQFIHTSTPNVHMFLHVQKLIGRTKLNVISHLSTLPEYDCTEMEELATTVIGGIKKSGLPIHVVIRPSDNGVVIVYYSSEKDSLDYENAELWIDNGRDTPRHLTLGKILKTTGINKIPV